MDEFIKLKFSLNENIVVNVISKDDFNDAELLFQTPNGTFDQTKDFDFIFSRKKVIESFENLSSYLHCYDDILENKSNDEVVWNIRNIIKSIPFLRSHQLFEIEYCLNYKWELHDEDIEYINNILFNSKQSFLGTTKTLKINESSNK